jgi:hypothetical protein
MEMLQDTNNIPLSSFKASSLLNAEEGTTFIYALIDPRDNEIRYIGKTSFPKQRLQGHMSMQRSKRMKNWIAELRDIGAIPVLSILETCRIDKWEEKEKHWIAHYRSVSNKLLNICSGGNGITAHIKETRDAIARIVREHLATPEGKAKRIEQRNRPEVRAKQSRAMIALYKNPEARAKTSEAGKARFKKPGELERHRETCIKNLSRPEVREKMAQATRRRYANNPEARKASSEAWKKAQTPEVIARRKASTRKHWLDADNCKLRSELMKRMCSTPEARSRLLASSKKALSKKAKAKRAKTMAKLRLDPIFMQKQQTSIKRSSNTPEGKARLSKAATIRWQKFRANKNKNTPI